LEEAKTILIVDDDKAILQSLEAILKMKGYEVETAETGQEAIEKSRKKIYNLAILDIKLPDMEGTELLVKMHETMPKMMKIMLTGYPTLENAVKSLNLGADAFLMKPVNPKELLKVVEEKLREQTEMEMLSEDKVRQWIETRMQKLKSSKER
jgi:two-component system NtrC family response regulator